MSYIALGGTTIACPSFIGLTSPSAPPPPGNFLLLVDGTDFVLLVDNSSMIILV